MQTNTDAEDESSLFHFLATAPLVIPQGAFETRHQPGHEVSVVDGLMAVTHRAWAHDLEADEPDAGPAAKQ